MNFAYIFKTAGKFVSTHAPEIMTGAAVLGTIQTAYFASTASIKAYDIIKNDEYSEGKIEDPKERIKYNANLVWRLYIPTALTGLATISLIICSNRLSAKRQAAVATALVTTQTYLSRYKDAVEDVLDEDIVEKVETRFAEKASEEAKSSKYSIHSTGGDDLFYDSLSGRYFKSDITSVREAHVNIKEQIINEYWASQNDVFDQLGLPRTCSGDLQGWNVDMRFDQSYRPHISPDGKPCIGIFYSDLPKDRAWRIG